jgi:ABC-2 type transport system ATP-binding protein
MNIDEKYWRISMQSVFLRISDIKKYYYNKKNITKALDGVTLDIYKGEIIGLLGVNGAGKTTLSSILATLHPATSGSIVFNNQSIYDDINIYRRNIGFCPQKINVDNDLTVEQNLVFAGRYMGVADSVIQDRLQQFYTQFNLERYKDSTPDTLSGGYARRVLIARALMHAPQIVILDEPTVGLDPHVRHQLWETIRSLKSLGVTVILTTHYLDEAEFLSDRICVLGHGRVQLIDTPRGLMTTYQKARLEDVFIQLIQEDTQQ